MSNPAQYDRIFKALGSVVRRQILDDLNTRMNEIKIVLTRRVNDIPTGKYLEADQFLSEFRDARQGIAEEQMETQAKFNEFSTQACGVPLAASRSSAPCRPCIRSQPVPTTRRSRPRATLSRVARSL